MDLGFPIPLARHLWIYKMAWMIIADGEKFSKVIHYHPDTSPAHTYVNLKKQIVCMRCSSHAPLHIYTQATLLGNCRSVHFDSALSSLKVIQKVPQEL